MSNSRLQFGCSSNSPPSTSPTLKLCAATLGSLAGRSHAALIAKAISLFLSIRLSCSSDNAIRPLWFGHWLLEEATSHGTFYGLTSHSCSSKSAFRNSSGNTSCSSYFPKKTFCFPSLTTAHPNQNSSDMSNWIASHASPEISKCSASIPGARSSSKL